MPNWTITKYHDGYKNLVEVAESGGVTIGDDREILKVAAESLYAGGKITTDNVDTLDADELKLAKAVGREYQLACGFLLGLDRQQYGQMLADMNNNYAAGMSSYPTTLSDAYARALTWQQAPPKRNPSGPAGLGTNGQGNNDRGNNSGQKESHGAAFVTGEQPASGKKDKSHITCFDCGQTGHYRGDKECPNYKGKDETTNVHVATDGNSDDFMELDFGFCQLGATDGADADADDDEDTTTTTYDDGVGRLRGIQCYSCGDYTTFTPRCWNCDERDQIAICNNDSDFSVGIECILCGEFTGHDWSGAACGTCGEEHCFVFCQTGLLTDTETVQNANEK